MPTSTQTLYEHLNTLTKQWFYDKGEIDTALEAKADAVDIPDVSDVIRTSETAGLVKNDGTIDTTSYQEAGDYIETSNTAGLVKNDGTIDTTSYQPSGNYIETSNTAGLVKNDGTIDTNTYLTSHQDISGKANSADLAPVATSGSYEDLTNVPETFTPAAHTQASSTITDTNTYSNIANVSGTQESINSAIDTKLGALLAIELIEVVSTRPTASASTMNKLYLIAESSSETEDAYEIFVTVRTGTSGSYSYAWEKVDTARIDLSGKAAVDHVHGNITNDGKIGSNANYFVTTTTGGLATSQSSIGNIDTSGAIGSTSGKVVTTTTNGVLTTSDWTTEVDAVIQNLITYGNSLNSS